MNCVARINRRSFVVGTAAVSGGLALGFDLPFGPKLGHAEVGGPEVNAWVVVQPDETVIIRIARTRLEARSIRSRNQNGMLALGGRMSATTIPAIRSRGACQCQAAGRGCGASTRGSARACRLAA